MKKILTALITLMAFIILTPPPVIFSQQDYESQVHMHVTIEAYHYLKNLGYNIPVMEAHLGDMDDHGTGPWQTAKITTGAHREDEEDVVFGHGGLLTTVNHFWDADNRANGDFTLTHLNGVGYFKNAYEKIYLYEHGNWYNQDNQLVYFPVVSGNTIHYCMYRNGLGQFYRDNTLWSEYKLVGSFPVPTRYNIQVSDDIKNRMVWEILGRMCHLLQDQTVPAHAHGDVHAGSECYEDWTGGNYGIFTRWTAGELLNINDGYGNPVRYFMYVANQLGDHWPSGPDCAPSQAQWLGDNGLYNSINGQGTYPILQVLYNALGNPPNTVVPSNQANWNLNRAISYTASLMLWFYYAAGLELQHPTPTNLYIITSPSPNRTIYNGQIGRTTAYATGTGFWFEWQQRRCTNPPPNGTWYGSGNPLHGIWYNIVNGNRYEVHNDTYSGQDCPGDPGDAPVYVIYEKVKACVDYPLRCTDWAWTNFTMAAGYHGGGCPYIFTSVENPILNPENNLLHKAEFDYSGEDLTDRYLLQGIPVMVSNPDEAPRLTVAVKELDNKSYSFDYVKLLKIQKPFNTKIGVTENNNIVQYDSLQVISADYATLNDSEITGDVQYGRTGGNFITGVQNDEIYLHYPENSFTKPAIIFEIEGDHITPSPVKDYAGHITANLSDGNVFETNFSRREYFSTGLIEIPFEGQDIGINIITIVFNRDFRLKYISLVNMLSENYPFTELSLSSAKMSIEIGEYNVDSALMSKDYNYLTLDSTEDQTLILQFADPNYDPSVAADYILEVNGRYNNLDSKTNNKNKIAGITPKLHNNYPNPFNPVTKIIFELPYKQIVKIKIYNILGQEMATLIDGELPKGLHEVKFDGSNYASGIYFYQIISDNYVESKKMLLIK